MTPVRRRKHLDDRRTFAMQTHGQHRALIPPFHAATIKAAAAHRKSVPQRNSCLRARNRQTAAMKARLTAFALAILGLASLRAQFDALPNIPDAAQRIWAMVAFFTILTNALLTAHLLAITNRWQISAVRGASLLLSIVMVGLIYHGLLSDLWAPTGLGWWADQGLHSEGNRPEGRELPAAIGCREEEAVAGMGEDGAKHDGKQGERHPARPQPEDQRDAAEEFGRDDDIGQRSRKAKALEILHRAGGREDRILQPGMGDEGDAHGDAQDQGGIIHTGGGGGERGAFGGSVGHRRFPCQSAGGSAGRDGLIGNAISYD